ncbi:hypothetical protein K439DRAFT_958697 [Ramaria rubella]|nr:hypothetical protein K439DRAFT_958697 [Ramaria rubella]
MCPSSYFKNAPLISRRVCGRWRQLALASPPLWTWVNGPGTKLCHVMARPTIRRSALQYPCENIGHCRSFTGYFEYLEYGLCGKNLPIQAPHLEFLWLTLLDSSWTGRMKGCLTLLVLPT